MFGKKNYKSLILFTFLMGLFFCTQLKANASDQYKLTVFIGNGGYLQYTDHSGGTFQITGTVNIPISYTNAQTINIYPTGSFHVADVKIDGQSQPRQTSIPFVYSFSQISNNHIVDVQFSTVLVTHDSVDNWGTFTSSCYNNLQGAVNAVTDEDIIAVDPGIYGNVDFSANNKRITIYSTQGPEVTFIDGNKENNCLRFDANSKTISVSGFTIQNGLSTNGGGIYIKDTSPQIYNCRIINNEATQYGGGIYISYDTSPELGNLYIRGNTAGLYGGGVYCTSTVNVSSPILYQSYIRGNTAGENGGGIYVNGYNIAAHAYIKMASCWIVENKSFSNGAGIYVNNAEANIFASTISNNQMTDGFGGAVYVAGSAYTPQVTIKNSILWNNGREIDGNKDIIDVTYSNVEMDSGVYGEISNNNRNIDPLFANSLIGDYHLTQNSPCIDVGSPVFPTSDIYQKDIDNQKRVLGLVVDLGGAEWNNSTFQVNFSANVTSGYSPLTVQFTNLSTSQGNTPVCI